MDLGSILEGYKEQAQFNPDLEHDVQNFTNEQADLSAVQHGAQSSPPTASPRWRAISTRPREERA